MGNVLDSGTANQHCSDHVRCIWSICAFDQTRYAFGQMHKPNSNLNLTLLQVCCVIDQILRNSSNAVQLINYQRRSMFCQMHNWPNVGYNHTQLNSTFIHQ